MDDWVEKKKQIKEAIETKLSDPDEDSIATLDDVVPLGNVVRCIIGIDHKKRIVERKKSPQYPHRDGTYDAYPLGRMIVNYNIDNGTIQVSAQSKKIPSLVEALSETLTGTKNNFSIKSPSAAKAVKSLVSKQAQAELSQNQIRVVELILHRVPMRGNPSFFHLKGEDLLETILQLRDADINIIGENLSKLHSMTFEMPNKGRIAINFETGGHDRFGDFSNEDEIEVYRILSSWGI